MPITLTGSREIALWSKYIDWQLKVNGVWNLDSVLFDFFPPVRQKIVQTKPGANPVAKIQSLKDTLSPKLFADVSP